LRVVHDDVARPERAEGHLGRPRYAELAYDQHVERDAEHRGDPSRHWNTTAHEPEHDHVVAPGVGPEVLREHIARMPAVGIGHSACLREPGRDVRSDWAMSGAGRAISGPLAPQGRSSAGAQSASAAG